MSIAILKKKTLNGNPRMAPLSGKDPLGFALNGTRRITGVVGETNLASTNKSSKNVSCCLNNINTVKLSVKNTKGMLASKWSRCNPLSCTKTINIVQPIDSGLIKHNTQGQYIYKKQAECLKLKEPTDEINQIKSCSDTCHTNHNYIGTTKIFKGHYTKNYEGAISQQEYINGKYLKNNSLLLGNCKKHFPMFINNNGCNVFYKTYEEARNAGLYKS